MKTFPCAAFLMVFGMGFAQQPRLVMLESASSELEVVQVLITPPLAMSARELGAWQLICEGLLEGTADFVKEDLFLYGGQAGIPPEVHWTQDLCRIQWVAPKGGGNMIARLTESVLTQQSLSDETLSRTRTILASPVADDWTARLRGTRGELTVPTEFVQLTRDRLIRPETVSICATPGAFSSFGGRFRDWRPRRVSADIRGGTTGEFVGPETAKIGLWKGSPILPVTSQSPKILAMIALGGGKTALLHQIIRDELAISYRQEAFMLPTQTGWQPMLQIGAGEPIPDFAIIRESILEGVDRFTTEDLGRFKKLATASLEGRNPLSPFWLSTRGPYSASDPDRKALESLAYLWGVNQVNVGGLKNDLNRVTLTELKEAIRELLAEFR